MELKNADKNANTHGNSIVQASTEPAAIGKFVGSFGLSFAVAVLVTAVLFAVKVVDPELEEWAEEAFGHAWLYQAVLALILFFGIGLIPIGSRLGGRDVAAVVFGSTVVSGLIIIAAAAFAAFA